uniref:Uncharacterized protein n=1 Tax=Proboscia inermis TaxID=420281 RepID=A0A7S0CL22_9STRA
MKSKQDFITQKQNNQQITTRLELAENEKNTQNLITVSLSLSASSSSSYFPDNSSSLYQFTHRGVWDFEEDIWSKGLELLTTNNHDNNHDDEKKTVRHPLILCILLGHG